MIKPNLFIIGEPKSGTTALYNFLKQHPDIFMSEEKEPHHFCTDFIRKANKKNPNNIYNQYEERSKYLSLFRGADRYKYAGEATTDLAYSQEAAKNMHDFNPNAKIIYCIREPYSFMRSLHKQNLRDFFENEKDFEKALALEIKRKQGKNVPKNCPSGDLILYKERTKYKEHAKRFLDLFDRDNFFLVIFEEFRRDNREIVNQIFNFLGIKQVEIDCKKHNVNKDVRAGWFREFATHSSLRKIAQKILPLKVRKKWCQVLNKITLKKAVDKENNKLKIRIKKELRPLVIELNKFLIEKGLLKHKDLLKEWGYKN
jgi:hypothetical protein